MKKLFLKMKSLCFNITVFCGILKEIFDEGTS